MAARRRPRGELGSGFSFGGRRTRRVATGECMVTPFSRCSFGHRFREEQMQRLRLQHPAFLGTRSRTLRCNTHGGLIPGSQLRLGPSLVKHRFLVDLSRNPDGHRSGAVDHEPTGKCGRTSTGCALSSHALCRSGVADLGKVPTFVGFSCFIYAVRLCARGFESELSDHRAEDDAAFRASPVEAIRRSFANEVRCSPSGHSA